VSVTVTEAGAEAAALCAALHAGGIGSAGPAWDEAAFAALLAQPGRRALVASEGGEPVGLLLLGLAADEAEILALAVLPAARRRGIGRALVAAACSRAAARGAQRLLLEVAEGNAAARALYGALGFVPVGRRRGYYPGGGDALVLARPLGPCSEVRPSSEG
jgi:ribosomal-protein-alanine N-acetyltransferase